MSTSSKRRLILPSVSLLAIVCGGAVARADAPANAVEIGYARLSFNSSSSQLSGPPGTTPPGATVSEEDTSALALVYERTLLGPLSVIFQTGTPPVVHLRGEGTAAPLGEVAATRAWFPAILAGYSFPPVLGIGLYMGAGVSYTWFTNNEVRAGYTAAFAGTSSNATLTPHTGPLVKVGATIPLASNWLVDFSYSRYWISTTATVDTLTPGLGVVSRKIDLTANPSIFGITVGYRF